MTDCGVITKVDIGSDHRLVRTTMRMSKRLARLKTTKNKNLSISRHNNSKV